MVAEIFVRQLDGCTYHTGGDNCTCACHAMWLYRASQRRIQLTSCRVRVESADKIAGTNLEQMKSIATAHGIPSTLYRPGLAATVKQLVIGGRYGTHWQGSYSVIAGTRYDCFDGNFRGNHDFYISGGTSTYARVGDPGADGRRDSIPNGYQNIPWTLMLNSAGRLDLGGGVTLSEEHGSGRVYALLTPADPVIPARLYSVVINSPRTQLYVRPNGATAGAVTKASYIVAQSKVGGLWWYEILTTRAGTTTANRGKYFKPTRYMEFTAQ